MSDKRLDKLFKDKLGNRNFGYQESYWDDFEKTLDVKAVPKSTPKGGSFGGAVGGAKIGFIVVPVLILTGLTFYFLNRNNEELIPDEVQTTTTNIIIEENNDPEKQKQESEQLNSNITPGNSVTTKDGSTEVSDGELKANESTITSIDISEEDFDFQTENFDKKNNDPQSQNTQQKGVVSFSDDSGPIVSTKSDNISDQSNAGVFVAEELNDDQINTKENNDNPEIIAATVASSSNIESNAAEKNYDSEENFPESNFSSANTNNEFLYDDISSIRMNSFAVMSGKDKEIQTDSTLKTKQAEIAVYRPNKIRPVFSIAAFGGASFISKELKSNLPELAGMIQQRNTYEFNKTAFTGGLEFETRYRGITFTTGIGWMNWGEDVQYQATSSDSLVIVDSTYFDIIDSSYWDLEEIIIGDTVYYDSVYVIDIDTTIIHISDTLHISQSDNLDRHNGKTKITYIEIPILIGYEFSFDRIILAVKGGVSIGFLTQTRGYYLNETADDLIPINTGYAVFRKTLINLELGLGVGYKLIPNLDIFLGAGYKMNLNSVFSDPDVFQKYKAYNLGLKLRYTF